MSLPPLFGGARAALGFLTRVPAGAPRETDLRWAPAPSRLAVCRASTSAP